MQYIGKSRVNRILFAISSFFIVLFVILNFVYVILSTAVDGIYELFFKIFMSSWIVIILWFLISLTVIYVR